MGQKYHLSYLRGSYYLVFIFKVQPEYLANTKADFYVMLSNYTIFTNHSIFVAGKMLRMLAVMGLCLATAGYLMNDLWRYKVTEE